MNAGSTGWYNVAAPICFLLVDMTIDASRKQRKWTKEKSKIRSKTESQRLLQVVFEPVFHGFFNKMMRDRVLGKQTSF